MDLSLWRGTKTKNSSNFLREKNTKHQQHEKWRAQEKVWDDVYVDDDDDDDDNDSSSGSSIANNSNQLHNEN